MRYAGFWVRFAATMVDTVLLSILLIPPLLYLYGADYLTNPDLPLIAGPADFVLNFVVPPIMCCWFLVVHKATPGKRLFGLQVLDQATGKAISVGQSLLRYAGYFIAMLPLGLGLLWVVFDKRKQGWHDKLARTVVICRGETE